MAKLTKVSRTVEGKVALITGAGSGMGRATACVFAEAGAKVIASDINEEQIDAVRPQSIDGAHFNTDFIFYDSGNHIFRVDLYDATDNGGTLTFTFNISTQSPFGYIFISAIAAGGLIFAGVIGIIFIPKMIKRRSKF